MPKQRSEKTQQSKRRRQEKREKMLLDRASQRMATKGGQAVQKKIDKRRLNRQKFRTSTSGKQRYLREVGLRQFDGRNPSHNDRHHMTRPLHTSEGKPLGKYIMTTQGPVIHMFESAPQEPTP